MGIHCLNSNAGLFCWMDLRPLLKEPTIKAEMALWHVMINNVKLNVSPGSSFHCTEAGWFRVCFANMDDDTAEIALQRIQKFVTKKEEEVATVKKKRFVRDLRWRIGVQIISITCESLNNFQITIEALEEAYNKAIEAKIRVKSLIITNSSKPLGTILDKDTLKSLVNFINERNFHLVCDEIYATTSFRPPHFTSISKVIQDMDCNDDLIHIVYSLSKDMGFPGFRVGIVYSYNNEVVSCA
ncbi:1-aminocyclopropane-1-carboxylate synthase 1 [Camellia lanceoleosa]|uniref:1-aminocyclopropane-1-carboxylate synthase 1 n=1 Tax=Camellia lanceoleosa TaxID=1840588 RepID=A0ACC0IR79_9ERIC|nr:1-aminocyclopropane-1-carboxylate synthase 1 [Camellia lanceoleosa]